MELLIYPGILLVFTVFLLIRAELKNNKKSIYVLKPLSTLLIIAAAVFALFYAEPEEVYFYGILCGLIFSLIGDIMLMFTDNAGAFRIGLVAFLLGHIAYTVSFAAATGSFYSHPLVPLIITIIAVVVFLYLRPGLGSMKIPVLVYILIISLMVCTSTSAFTSSAFSRDRAFLVFSGALLFYISDVFLAVNKFRVPFRLNRLSLIPYFAGQFCIAASLWPF